MNAITVLIKKRYIKIVDGEGTLSAKARSPHYISYRVACQPPIREIEFRHRWQHNANRGCSEDWVETIAQGK